MVAEITFAGRPAGDNGVETLHARLRGELIQPNDAAYEQDRKTWSGNVDKRPGFVVRAADVIDVMAAVEFAREQGLTVVVRSGGHSIAGQSTIDGGIVIDLSQARSTCSAWR
jgi:FAD/FMN-containing dehydrogenase